MGSARPWAAGVALAMLAAGECAYGRVAFSPDSNRFAAVAYADRPYTQEDGAVCELWVTDVGTGAHRLVAREEVVGLSAAWSRDGSALWFLHGPGSQRLQ